MEKRAADFSKVLSAILCVAMLVTLLPTTASAAPTVVENSLDSGPDSLRNVIASASSGDVITFDPSAEPYVITLNSQLDIGAKSLTIDASALSSPVTIKLSGDFRHFTAGANATLTLKNIIMTGRGTNSNNGGVATNGTLAAYNCVLENCYRTGDGGITVGTAILENCTFTGNYSTYGGASVMVNGGNANLKDCTFTDNSASSFGAAVYVDGSSLTMTGCKMTNNSAVQGGAVFAGPQVGTTVTMVNCTADNNRGILYGGAVVAYRGPITLKGCTFINNSLTSSNSIGGAVLANKGAVVTDCLFADNTAVFAAGGIYINDDATLTNCTFAGNQAENGGGLYLDISAVLKNCTVSGNTATVGGGIYADANSFTLLGSLVSGNYKDDGTSNEIFRDTGYNTLINGSGALIDDTAPDLTGIDSGSAYYIVGVPGGGLSALLETETKVIGGQNRDVGKLDAQGVILINTSGIACDAIPAAQAWLPATDQRGITRPQGAAADIGAAELTAASTDATVNPTTGTFDKYASSAGNADVLTTLTLGSHTLNGITLGGTLLTLNTHYTASSGVYTFKKEYLATLSTGAQTFTFDMSGGVNPTFTVTVSDSTPAVPASASVGNITISGWVGFALGGEQTATITLVNDTVVAPGLANVDASGWFTGLPAGITVTANASAGSSTITLTFGGTPTAASIQRFVITIPGSALASGIPIAVYANPSAMFNIAGIPLPASDLPEAEGGASAPFSELPRTGDSFPFSALLAVMGITLLAMGWLGLRLRKGKSHA